MKQKFQLPALLLCLCLLALSACNKSTSVLPAGTEDKAVPAVKGDIMPNTGITSPVRAMWLSQYEIAALCTEDGKKPCSSDIFLQRIARLTDNLKACGIRTLFVQVRPNTDSFYPSALFPLSAFVTGSDRVQPDFDVFGTLCEQLTAAGIAVHAWLNPYRSMTATELKSLPARYPVAGWFASDGDRGRLIVEVNGRFWLNPAYEEVQRLILLGAEEILTRYPAVQGLHIDDYFYPTTDPAFDADAYREYREGGGTLATDDFRRNCVNRTVSALWRLCHRYSKAFGVSPGGNTDRNYRELYADVALWCRESGYLDYLCPQVYFGLEHGSCPFAETCREFSDMAKAGNIPLIIGMTSEKAWAASCGKTDIWAGAGKNEWLEHRDILFRCLKVTQTVPGCVGVSLFGYRLFFDPVTVQKIPGTAEEAAALFAALPGATWEIPYQTAP